MKKYIVGVQDGRIVKMPEICTQEDSLECAVFFESPCGSPEIGTKEELIARYPKDLDESSFEDDEI